MTCKAANNHKEMSVGADGKTIQKVLRDSMPLLLGARAASKAAVKKQREALKAEAVTVKAASEKAAREGRAEERKRGREDEARRLEEQQLKVIKLAPRGEDKEDHSSESDGADEFQWDWSLTGAALFSSTAADDGCEDLFEGEGENRFWSGVNCTDRSAGKRPVLEEREKREPMLKKAREAEKASTASKVPCNGGDDDSQPSEAAASGESTQVYTPAVAPLSDATGQPTTVVVAAASSRRPDHHDERPQKSRRFVASGCYEDIDEAERECDESTTMQEESFELEPSVCEPAAAVTESGGGASRFEFFGPSIKDEFVTIDKDTFDATIRQHQQILQAERDEKAEEGRDAERADTDEPQWDWSLTGTTLDNQPAVYDDCEGLFEPEVVQETTLSAARSQEKLTADPDQKGSEGSLERPSAALNSKKAEAEQLWKAVRVSEAEAKLPKRAASSLTMTEGFKTPQQLKAQRQNLRRSKEKAHLRRVDVEGGAASTGRAKPTAATSSEGPPKILEAVAEFWERKKAKLAHQAGNAEAA